METAEGPVNEGKRGLGCVKEEWIVITADKAVEVG